jgi:hypothetical protein
MDNQTLPAVPGSGGFRNGSLFIINEFKGVKKSDGGRVKSGE